ncbi:MAG TPA: O-antigen ligase family protein [Anaeromyxobacter sp.]|nr:O-antigen ligase family protein [Anaeromyxobacter sp.]
MPEASRPPRSLPSTVGLALLAVAVVALPLLRGGVGLGAEGLALCVTGLAAGFTLWRSGEVPRCALALAAAVLLIALQLVPLAPAVHALLPGTEAVFRLSLEPLGEYPGWRPLTLDVPATARELAKAAAYLAAFVAAWTYAETRRRRGRLFAALGLSAAAVSVAALGAGLLGAQPFLAGRFPFVNPNHLAGFLDLGAFVALGLAVRSHGQHRLLWGLVFAGASAALFASLSRGGVAAYLVGLTIFAVLFLSRRRGVPVRRRAAVLAAAAGAGLSAAAYLALGPVARELQTLTAAPGQEAKLGLWPAAFRMIRDFPLLGIGRGSFATVFPAYEPDPTVLTFTHLENETLQPLVDLGLPGGLLLVGVLGLVWLRAAVRTDLSAAEMGLVAGVAALFAHEQFDFSVELPGVAIPLAVSLGLLARGARVVRAPPWLTRAAIVALLVAATAGLAAGARLGAEVEPSISDAPTERALALATRAAVLRPGDYLPHAAAGARLWAAERCGEALPWLSRAAALAPGVPEPHLYAARCLAERAPSLARTEYRTAFVLGLPVLDEATQRWTALEEVLELVPETGDGLLALASQLAVREPALARQVLARAWEEYGDRRALVPLGSAALASGDREAALDLARRVLDASPLDEDGHRLAAESLLALGRPDEARAALERAVGAVPGSTMLLRMLAGRLVAERRYSEARRVAETMPVRTASDLAQREQLVAGALAAQGRLPEALQHAEAAAAALPDSPAPLLQLAQLASQAGLHAEALAALERAAALPGAAPGAYAAQLAAVRAKLAERDARRRDALLAPEPLPVEPIPVAEDE